MVGILKLITMLYNRCHKTRQRTLRPLISPPQCQGRQGKFLKAILQQEGKYP